MLILLHVLLALAGVVCASFAAFSPTRSRLRLSYGFEAATLISGTALVVTTHAPLVSSCMSGLAYLAIMALLTAIASKRLAY